MILFDLEKEEIMDYLYDGTFEGLLTCIYYHYKIKEATGIYDISSYQQSIVNQSTAVVTDRDKAKIVSDAVINKISEEAYVYIYYCFLSCAKYKENQILEFLKFAFKYGKNTMNFFTHEKVFPIKQIYTKVAREEHRFLGILRFADVGGVLYAKYSPDNDITILLIDHFADRYKYERFIIHDEKRRKAAVYSEGAYRLEDVDISGDIEYSKDEKLFQGLWKQYFTDLAITERKNIDLQFQFVPGRYRKNMAEFK